MKSEKAHRLRTPKGTLGTFPGVFTPSVLTILGIILFLRLGYVVGHAGLARALIIIGLANAISVLTSFSLSAIATNLKVKGGGDYYLISRTLGIEFGGSIGIVLFLAQSVSIAFYSIGFGEALSGILPIGSRYAPQIIAALAVSFLFIFAWLGADWATKFQYVVMAALAAALISFFAGGMGLWNGATLVRNWASPDSALGFWAVFAIFFPAVTGFTQGVSMSGDLEDPGRSLPLGTFLAVGVSILVYFGATFVFAASLPSSVLMGDYGAMQQVAYLGFLIHVGVIAATLSSAMASFLGAPRILQSMARDRIFLFLLAFAKGSGPTTNPRRGVLLSAGIAFATIALGNLNFIAPLVSMFFLISYGLLNYATFYEARTESPSFRPRFRWYDYRLSLLGWLVCLGVMLAIDLRASAVAMAVLFAIHQYLKRTAGPARWADSRRSYHLQRLREHLLAAAAEPEHPRDWRPQILALSNDAERRANLLRFSAWLEGGSGLTTVVRILEGEGVKMLKPKEEEEKELASSIENQGLNAFPLVITAPNLRTGIHALVEAFGIGPIRANTLLLNWHGETPKSIPGLRDLFYAKNIRGAFRLGCNIIILKTEDGDWPGAETLPQDGRRIDVWWLDDATSHLMLLLAYLMTRSEEWEGVHIRVLAAGAGDTSELDIDSLKKALEAARIQAEPEVVDRLDMDNLAEQSSGASIVFLPFRIRGNQLMNIVGTPLKEVAALLPAAAFVMAAEDIELDAEPEEGRAGELAAAIDAFTDARRKADDAENVATKAAEEAEAKVKAMASSIESGADEALMSKVKAVLEAKKAAIKAPRRAAKAATKAESAGRVAENMGAKLPEENEGSESS